jgi:hypothetical protein
MNIFHIFCLLTKQINKRQKSLRKIVTLRPLNFHLIGYRASADF